MHGAPQAPEEAVAAGAAELAAAPEYSDFPCSVAQERFWLLDRLEPGNPSYNVAVRWRLEGRVSTQLLERAWGEIVARHEILRTRFVEVDGKPVQRVAPHCSFKLVEIDLSALPAEARSGEGDRIGLIEARAPFDLSEGPLLRVVLLRHSATLSVILITTHQIVSDGWSIGVMAREMGTIYEALSRQQPIGLEPLAIQYGDYALWQLEWLRQRGTQAETAYWSRQLAGVKPFEVLADRPRPAVPTTNGAIASLVLPRELTNRMQALSAEHGVTLFSAVVSILCATLARYTGKEEIVIGTQVSDRDQVELEPMIGQFVNSLILRNEVRGDPPFTQLLERVSTTISEALEHRHIPIERLLGMVKAGRGGSNAPPVSVNFIFQRTFIQNKNYGEFALVDLPSLVAGAIYDLNLFMVERPDGWRFSCQYNTDQFEAATAKRLLSYFQAALESAVQDPTRRISQLRLADPAESGALLGRLEGAPAAAAAADVIRQFNDCVAATPAAVALVCGERRVSYAQLQAQAQQLAQQLHARGIGAGDRVAICFPPGPERVVGMLATLKAGASCVPLEAQDPPQYLQALIEAAAAKVALAAAPLGAALKVSAGVISELGGGSGNAAPLPATAATEAAVWFTPADPEHPAAVSLSRVELSERLAALRERLALGGQEVCLALSPVSVQDEPLQLLLPLLCGARVILPTAAELTDAGRLGHLLKRSHVSVVFVGAHEQAQRLASVPLHTRVGKILCQRSALDAELVGRLLARSAELWALHGYLESSGCLSVRRILQPHDLCLLGEPLPAVRYRVLAPDLSLAPIGTQGQLYLGGAGIASSYLQPRTPSPFIADPTAPGHTLLRTPDTARLRSDGSVELTGEEAQLRIVPHPDTLSAPVDEELERQLTQIWTELLGREGIDPNANFFELGGHSLLAARMLARVEGQFHRRITLAALFRAPSIRGLARLLRSEAREFDFRQMVKLQADGSRLPLIAINNTGVYYLLAKRLGPEQPVTSLQVFDPSAKRAALPATLEEIAAEYVQLIRRVHPKGPYVLAGWCVAGALAFEIARQLVESGQPVANLFLMDSWVPRYFERLPAWRRLIGTHSLRWQMTRVEWRKFTAGRQTLAQFFNRLLTVRRVRHYLERLWRLARGGGRGSGTEGPPLSGPESYDRWLLQYLKTSTDRYEPRRYRGHITVFRSTHEPTGWLFDPLAGWGSYAAGGAELLVVEGNHFTMFQDPGATQMAMHMATRIPAQPPSH